MRRLFKPLWPVLGELAVVGGASLLALFWIIPAQTTADPFVALQPSLVPNVCAAAILLLVLIQLCTEVRKRCANEQETRSESKAHSWRSALGAMAITIVGVLAFHLAGLLATSLVVVPGLMLWLGERRYLRIAVVALCCALPFTPLLN